MVGPPSAGESPSLGVGGGKFGEIMAKTRMQVLLNSRARRNGDPPLT
jgi:hypothetical protein